MQPKVSIVMTVYNAERYLSEAVGSVLAQSFGDLELILWDDGSTDGSADIARDLSETDPRIRFVASEHRGRGRVLAEACARAEGDFLGLVDADDRLEPTAVEECAEYLNHHPEIGMVYTDHQIMNSEGRPGALGRRCRIPYSKERLLLDFMTHHFRLLRRSVYEQIGGFDPTFPLAMDYDLCLRLSEVTEIAHLPRALYHYRQHPESLSATHRLEQALWTQRAIQNALDRRGMDWVCELEVRPRFRLRRKEHGTAPGPLG
ncbi:MAG TPA: glycosyltransferase [Candidatus Sumerlaeota bacterium]|nr:glycosyltransferase [Candidatus Sumerlaeota bacterium]